MEDPRRVLDKPAALKEQHGDVIVAGSIVVQPGSIGRRHQLQGSMLQVMGVLTIAHLNHHNEPSYHAVGSKELMSCHDIGLGQQLPSLVYKYNLCKTRKQGKRDEKDAEVGPVGGSQNSKK